MKVIVVVGWTGDLSPVDPYVGGESGRLIQLNLSSGHLVLHRTRSKARIHGA